MVSGSTETVGVFLVLLYCNKPFDHFNLSFSVGGHMSCVNMCSQDTLRPVYWLLQDRRLNALVIAVRGTFSMSDFVSDLCPGCELMYSVG